jgi:Phage tail assembly chaperone protein
MYYKIETQQVLSEQEIRNEFPNTSFTVPFQAPDGYAPILETPQPEITTYQSAFKNGVEQDSLGNYVWAWVVTDWDQEAIDAYDAQQKQTNKKQAEQLLTESDWTQMPDVTLINKEAFTTYRAELRAIALNPPVSVTEWPEKPEEIWTEETVITPFEEDLGEE